MTSSDTERFQVSELIGIPYRVKRIRTRSIPVIGRQVMSVRLVSIPNFAEKDAPDFARLSGRRLMTSSDVQRDPVVRPSNLTFNFYITLFGPCTTKLRMFKDFQKSWTPKGGHLTVLPPPSGPSASLRFTTRALCCTYSLYYCRATKLWFSGIGISWS